MKPTAVFSVPRRRGWSIIWIVFLTTIEAYWHRSSSITFSLEEVNRE